MHLLHYYLEMYHRLGASLSVPVKAGSSELEGILYCTKRNVRHILHKMSDREWIVYTAGGGRGHRSTIIFLLEYEAALKQAAGELVQSGRVEEAFRLVERHGHGTSFNLGSFIEWLNAYFGTPLKHSDEDALEVLRLPLYRKMLTADPAQAFYGLDIHIVSQVFETLVVQGEDEGEFVGRLAHHWSCSTEGTRWRFDLRKGIFFHQGRELEAEDVQFSLERLMDPAHLQCWLVENIKSIHILGKYKLELILKQPNFRLLSYLSYPPASIVSRNEFNRSGKLVGTGPFRLAYHTANLCRLEAFDHYSGHRTLLDRVELYSIPEHEGTRLDERHSLLRVHTDELHPESSRSVPDWTQHKKLTGCTVLTLNQSQKDKLLTLQPLREALNQLIDRSRMVAELGRSRHSTSQGFNLEHAGQQPADFNPVYGRELLEQSGLPSGKLRLQLLTYGRHESDARWLSREFESYGITLDVRVVAWEELLQSSVRKEADLILYELLIGEGIIRLIESVKSHFIRDHLQAEQISRISGLIRSWEQGHMAGAEELLAGIEAVLREESAVLFLANKIICCSSSPYLHHVRLHPRGWVDFKELWYDPAIEMESSG
ncbi:ABC transporter substrate-binding protein [Paenibacillus sp. JX-17]|uniref:ABC transporter substrate-binding protein n=1 Tax=Paenibacillus lacisoli TaxID=3064525 RepID=A0ABT9CFH8_9BACL|nr:ABC transporter substrate-binding protein [Paenibacillus sp. JX-17]MDO7908031.1 ABC transporter substrate-binding protein [Paenibacillus sp. JX-17]